MPVEVIRKKKTEPQSINQHPDLVPLRMVKAPEPPWDHREKGLAQKWLEDHCYFEGDIYVKLPGWWSSTYVFNATRGKVLDNRHIDKATFIRAYDVQQIVLTNDDEPAPIV